MEILNSSSSNQGNLATVLRMLRIYGKQSNAELSRALKVPAGTIARHLARLEGLNLVRKTFQAKREDKQVGKPPVLYETNPEVATIMAIEVNKGKIRIAAADFSGKILFEQEHKSAPKERIIKQIKLLIDEQLKHWPSKIIAPGCISLGVGGTISRDNILSGNIFPPHVNLHDVIRKDIKIPVLIENDANLAIIAEKNFGFCRDSSNIVCILDSYDFGIGLFINDKLYKGAHGRAGETTINNYFQEHPPENLTGGLKLEDALKNNCLTQADCSDHGVLYQILGQQAASGDNLAQDVLKRLANELAEETLRLLRLFDPEKIIIAGNIVEAGQFFKDMFFKKIAMVYDSDNERFKFLQIMFSDLQQKIVIKGAISVGIDKLINKLTEKSNYEG